MNKNPFMEMSKKTLTTHQYTGNLPGGNGVHYSVQLLEKARLDTDTVLKELGSQLSGLIMAKADSCLKEVGTNEIVREKRKSDNAAEKLKTMLNNTTTLVRGGREEEVSLKVLVPGDIIRLAAGDIGAR